MLDQYLDKPMLKAYNNMLNEERKIVPDVVEVGKLNSGYARNRESRDLVQSFLNGDIYVKTSTGIYAAVESLRGNKLKKGMLVAARYNKYNQGLELYEILGLSDPMSEGKGDAAEEKVKFDSVKDALASVDAKSIHEMARNQEKMAKDAGVKNTYGFHSNLVVKDLDDGDSGAWFYPSEGRWCRGSGAEPLSFILVKKIG